jgi:predicted Holliday junction resolvase-like endonuclease
MNFTLVAVGVLYMVVAVLFRLLYVQKQTIDDLKRELEEVKEKQFNKQHE